MQAEILRTYGWNVDWGSRFMPFEREGLEPGRIIEENRQSFQVLSVYGERYAEVSGRFRFNARARQSLPAVGDWVALRPLAEGPAIIEAILPRKTQFVRKVAGRQTEGQVVAANVDWVFIMMSLNRDFSLRRLERYLVLTWESGASPVIILSKSDLCQDKEAAAATINREVLGVPVHAISALTGEGLEEVQVYLAPGKTIVLLGSSGVGKSTLVNEFLGKPSLRTQPIRSDDDRGRHTTTTRQLIPLPCGSLVLDSPGMRELQLWEADEGMQTAFEEIETYARQCRFRDCRHRQEPGCAVREALRQGTLDEARYQSYEKLQRELRHLAIKQDLNARRNEKRKWKVLSQIARHRADLKRGGR
jgi:ribosome biogenesis GTPase / thiamine phosphate phosphatase